MRRSPGRPSRPGPATTTLRRISPTARGETLQEHLTWQLEMSRLDERDMRIGAAIIDAINDDGYVIEPLEEIARNLQPEIVASTAEVERVLRHVQAMDPAGVGARSVSECIELQLRQLDPDTPGRDTALRDRRQLSRSSRGPAVRAAATSVARHRRGNGARAGAGARLPAAPRLERAFRARRIHRARRVRAPYRARLGGRDQSREPAAHPRQPKLRRSHRPLRRSRDAAHAVAGSALADSQPGNPQRNAAQSGALHRAATVGVPRERRRVHAADDPEGRGRGRADARIDDLARHDEQVHAHASWRVRVSLFLLQPRGGERRHRDVLDGDPRQDPQAGGGRRTRQAAVRQPHRRNPVAGGRAGGAAHGREIPRGARYSALQRTQESFRCR